MLYCFVLKVRAAVSTPTNALKRTIKELSQFDNKKPEELELEFEHFDAANSYPSSPFKGRINSVDLDFVYKQLLDGHKLCNTTLSLTQYAADTYSKFLL